jgi:hypothetical protein
LEGGDTTTTKASIQQPQQNSTTSRRRRRRNGLEVEAGVYFVPLLFLDDPGLGVCLGDDAVAAAAAMMSNRRRRSKRPGWKEGLWGVTWQLPSPACLCGYK